MWMAGKASGREFDVRINKCADVQMKKSTNNNPKSKIELLAPAGSWELLLAAIQAGADAVYFGVEQLNMRAKSINNFKRQS